MSTCPCGSGVNYADCCEPVISGAQPASTAEQLMRARYSAYVGAQMDFIFETTHPDQRQGYDHAGTKEWAESSEWLGLTILRTEQGGPEDKIGAVEFSAKFRTEGKDQEHFEVALFGREEGRWVYTGQLNEPGKTVRRETPKVGRNDPCPCGSGKKYKKCCGVAA